MNKKLSTIVEGNIIQVSITIVGESLKFLQAK